MILKLRVKCDLRKVRIAIIDSGISRHPRAPQAAMEKTTLIREDGSVAMIEGAVDRIGHGTAVASLIAQGTPDASLYIIKAFDDTTNVEEEIILGAMAYCIDEIRPDIIHMSSGITYCENLRGMKQQCEKAFQRGIIIVAAFDNLGSLSYPATIETVVGVDVSNSITKGYVFSHRRDVNIIVPNLTHRLPWVNESYFSSNGTSFNTCLVTSMIANILRKDSINRSKLFKKIEEEATGTFPNDDTTDDEYTLFPHIRRAVMFPFNKELHSLVRCKHMLSFELSSIYDIRYQRNVGKYPEDVLSIPRDKQSTPLMSYEDINWNMTFDTFILGHVSEIESRTKHAYAKEIAEKCLLFSKNLISLTYFHNYKEYQDIFRRKELTLYIPQISNKCVPKSYDGKLRTIGTPVLGVFGTSSRQGKFTLQVRLRDFFMEEGFSVGQLGTEPTSLFFGFDEVFPSGYESTVEINGAETIAVVNKMMGNIEDKYPDIIIVGSQSQTIPQHTGNLSLYMLEQHAFLLATEPDAVVLCVNMFDSIKYIERTIRYIESLVYANVIALVMFPMKREEKAGILTNKLIEASCQDIEAARTRLANCFDKSVFIADEDIHELGAVCVNFFGQ